MKKNVVNRVVFTLVMVAALCSMTSSVFAASMNVDDVTAEVSYPRYVSIRNFTANLNISSSGYASCQLLVTLYGSYTGEATMYLQDRSSGWRAVESWSGTGSGCSGSYYVTKGDTYRVKGELRVYDKSGNLVDNATVYSDTVSY